MFLLWYFPNNGKPYPNSCIENSNRCRPLWVAQQLRSDSSLFDMMSPDEKQVIDRVAESHGREWAEEYKDLILAQARLVGEL